MADLNVLGATFTIWLLKGLFIGIIGLWVFIWIAKWKTHRLIDREQERKDQEASHAAFLRELEHMKQEKERAREIREDQKTRKKP